MTSKFFVTSLGDIINIDSVASFRIEGEEGKKRVWYESYVYMTDGSKVPFLDISADSFMTNDGVEVTLNHKLWYIYQECMIECLLEAFEHMKLVSFEILDEIGWNKFLKVYENLQEKEAQCKTALHRK